MRRLSNGLTKLASANVQVSQLKIDLTELQPQLVVQSELVRTTLAQLEIDGAVARDKETIVQAEANIVNS